MHLIFENCEINSIYSNWLRAFQEHQECPKIPIPFSVSILFDFHWKNGSIISSFDIITPNNLKQSWCTLTHQKLFENTKSATWSTMVWDMSTWKNKTKQTTLLHIYIYIYIYGFIVSFLCTFVNYNISQVKWVFNFMIGIYVIRICTIIKLFKN